MKTIKIAFSGKLGTFGSGDNFITRILKKKYNVVISDNPDFLFYSVDSNDFLKYDCVRIFYTAENITPDFNLCDYAIGFSYINFDDRYFRYPIYLVDGYKAYQSDDYGSDLVLAQHKHEKVDNYIKRKKAFCAFVYSNRQAVRCREVFFRTLSQYKLVDSGGRIDNNIGGPVDSKLNFQTSHKFVIAFENTSNSGYTTEKIVHAFAAGAIPIYWGDPQISKVFNPKSFINCNAYGVTANGDNTDAFNRIIDDIITIDNDDSKYRAILEQPAFQPNYCVSDQKKGLEAFLTHIFDQDYEQTFRRNRFFWGKRYEVKQRIGNNTYQALRKLIPIRDGIRKITNRK